MQIKRDFVCKLNLYIRTHIETFDALSILVTSKMTKYMTKSKIQKKNDPHKSCGIIKISC